MRRLGIASVLLLAWAGVEGTRLPAIAFTEIPQEDTLRVSEAPSFESIAFGIAQDIADSASNPPLPIEELDRGIDLATYADHPRVASYLRYFSGRGRGQMARWLQRGERYLPMIRNRLAAVGLPEDLGYLALIESGFSNNAVSRAGAVGMWQFMPGTARDYGLRVDRHVDERRNPIKATDAAVRHLRDLTEQFGSPYLAAAAYNAGAARVSSGLERLRALEIASGLDADSLSGNAADRDFFRLSDSALLAKETRNYVPQLIAAALIAREPERYGFSVEQDSAGSAQLLAEAETVAPRARTTEATPEQQLEDAATRLAARQDEIARDSDAYGAGVRPRAARGEEARRARIASTQFRSARGAPAPGWARRDRPASSRVEASSRPARPRHAVVRRGDSIEEIAERYDVSVERLRKANALPVWYVMRPGMVLTIPSS